MSHRDLSAIAVAALALLMASVAWVADALTPRAGHIAEAGLRHASAQVLESQPTGQPLSWRDPASGIVATISASTPFQDVDGRWCRPYSVTFGMGTVAGIGHGGETVRDGVACRGRAGAWTPRAAPQQIATADGFDRWLDRLTDRPQR